MPNVPSTTVTTKTVTKTRTATAVAFIVGASLGLAAAAAFITSRSAPLGERLAGYVLLQVESRGEAWYVNPTDLKRYYMRDGQAAYEIMRHFGLGITNADLARLQGNDAAMRQRLSGRIVLQVQSRGEAFYVCPRDASVRYIKNGDAAYQIMRECSLGISNKDLSLIPAGETLSYSPAPPPPVTPPNKNESSAPAKPAWQTKVEQLSLPGYSKTVDAKGNIVLASGDYRVILPDNNADDFGKFSLYQLRVCSDSIASYLGRKPFTGAIIASKYEVNSTSQVSGCCGNAPEYAIRNLLSSESFSFLAYSDSAYWKNPSADWNICLGGHEELHRFFVGIFIPGFANEGLATLLEQRYRKLPGAIASPTLHECREKSFVATAVDGTRKEIPYVPIDRSGLAEHGIYWYYTGACFWERVEKQYGQEKLREIITASAGLATDCADSVQCTRQFIDQAVTPVLGDSAWQWIRNFNVLNPPQP